MAAAKLFNFDGIVGPTHNYAGLAYGNIASQRHRNEKSNPRAAALQGLAKMKLFADMGVGQAVLPPHDRPNLTVLRRLGFSGSDAQVLEMAGKADPVLLAACSSASAMWAANAATVCPSADSGDGRVHFTPANLASQLHRAIEVPTTAKVLTTIFPGGKHFVHHPPLGALPQIGDEGAANHTRLGATDGGGVQIFVYGRRGLDGGLAATKFPARQTLEASCAIARLHLVDAARTMFVKQNPRAIDAGAFHNDVVAVGEGDVFFYHEQAYEEASFAEQLDGLLRAACGRSPRMIRVPASRVSLEEAVKSYLFNSQLVLVGPAGSPRMELIAPMECRENAAVAKYLDETVGGDSPIAAVRFVDVRQSMNNGGGPACLRQRVYLTEAERQAASGNVFFNDALYDQLVALVERHYREELVPGDLADSKLLEESRTFLEALARLLDLGAIYEFLR
jgi:succinylarginine dihydrolase